MTCGGLYAAIVCASLTPPMMYDYVPEPSVREIIIKAAQYHKIPESLALGVAEVESKFNCHAVGKAGEIGLFQLKPTTAFYLGYAGSTEGLKDCITNSYFGVMHLRRAYERCGKDIACTISLHNRGLKAKPKPMAAYTQKVKKKMVKADPWVR